MEREVMSDDGHNNNSAIQALREQIKDMKSDLATEREKVAQLTKERDEFKSALDGFEGYDERLKKAEGVATEYESLKGRFKALDDSAKAKFEDAISKIDDAHKPTLERLATGSDYMEKLSNLEAALSLIPKAPEEGGSGSNPPLSSSDSAPPTDGGKQEEPKQVTGTPQKQPWAGMFKGA